MKKRENRNITQQVLGTVAGLVLVAGQTAPAWGAPASDSAEDGAPATDEGLAQDAVTSPRAAAAIQGIFSYSQQTALSTAEEIAELFKDTRELCGVGGGEATSLPAAESADAWPLEVRGAVKNAFTATFGALADTGTTTDVIGCACGAGADGAVRAVQAKVSGVSVQRLLAQAVPEGDANAITFIGADGAKATLPLWYVFAHRAVIASEIADEPAQVAMGATVQLWVESAPGWCFVKDVVAIELSCEDETPVAPDAVEEFAQ